MATVKRTVEEEQLYQEQEYQDHFDTEAYLKEYVHESNPYIRAALTALHTAFAIEVTTGDTLLDFGCGPNIYSMIAASNRFKNIVASDFIESNRTTITKWLQADPDCHDYSGIFKTAAALENNKNYQDLEARVRKSVQEVIPCNVHLSNPIAPDERQFDVIVSCFAVCSASLGLESYRKAVSNVSNLLKAEGKLVIVGALQGSFYDVGNHRFQGPYLTKENVEHALVDAGLRPVHWTIMPMTEAERGCDSNLTYMAIATKATK